MSHPDAGASIRGYNNLGGTAGGLAAVPTTPLMPRLIEHRGQLLAISHNLNMFETRMNGTGDKVNPSPGNDYPPSSIEDIMSQIEAIVRDINEVYARITNRF